jgi:hypothetical protein
LPVPTLWYGMCCCGFQDLLGNMAGLCSGHMAGLLLQLSHGWVVLLLLCCSAHVQHMRLLSPCRYAHALDVPTLLPCSKCYYHAQHAPCLCLLTYDMDMAKTTPRTTKHSCCPDMAKQTKRGRSRGHC